LKGRELDKKALKKKKRSSYLKEDTEKSLPRGVWLEGEGGGRFFGKRRYQKGEKRVEEKRSPCEKEVTRRPATEGERKKLAVLDFEERTGTGEKTVKRNWEPHQGE